MKKWYSMLLNAAAKTAVISIYDEIGGWGVSAKSFRQELIALGDVENIELRLNSPGGSVMDGFAIYNMLKEHPANIVAKIDGWAASMASIIAMAADSIEMPGNTWMMIHNPWTLAIGEASELKSMADVLEKMQGHAVLAYQTHTDLSAEDIQALMDAATWMDGNDAVAKGFANVLIDDIEIAASVDKNKLENVPEGAAGWIKPEAKTDAEKAKDKLKQEGNDNDTDKPNTDKKLGKKGGADDNAVATADVAYEEGEAAGLAKGIKQGEESSGVKVTELTAKVAEQATELATAKAELKTATVAVSVSTAKMKKLGDGFIPTDSVDDTEVTPETFEAACEKFGGMEKGYTEAVEKYPELFKEYRERQKATRVEK